MSPSLKGRSRAAGEQLLRSSSNGGRGSCSDSAFDVKGHGQGERERMRGAKSSFASIQKATIHANAIRLYLH